MSSFDNEYHAARQEKDAVTRIERMLSVMILQNDAQDRSMNRLCDKVDKIETCISGENGLDKRVAIIETSRKTIAKSLTILATIITVIGGVVGIFAKIRGWI